MIETIVTGWSTQNYEEYAGRFIKDWIKNIPEHIKLRAYVDDNFDIAVDRFETKRITDIPGYKDFCETFIGEKKYHGLIGDNYDYKFDVIKWCKQAFITWDAAKHLKTKYLYWFDADVNIHTPLPKYLLRDLMKDKEVTYFGRGKLHPDIAYVGYDIEECYDLIRVWKNLYSEHNFQNYEEWHSAYLWRVIFNDYATDLTPNFPLGPGKSIWERSPLGDYSMHMKGTWKFNGTNIKKIEGKERL